MTASFPGLGADIAIAVLAAGSAKRFGGGKLDRDLAGRALGRWATDIAERAGFARRFLVIGDSPPQFADDLDGWVPIVNEHARAGIGTSIAAAAKGALGARRLVIALADMPLVEAAHLRALAAGNGAIFTDYGKGRKGVPAAFAHRHLDKLRRLDSGKGAADIDWGEPGETVAPRCTSSLLDVDTTDDLEAMRKRIGGEA